MLLLYLLSIKNIMIVFRTSFSRSPSYPSGILDDIGGLFFNMNELNTTGMTSDSEKSSIVIQTQKGKVISKNTPIPICFVWSSLLYEGPCFRPHRPRLYPFRVYRPSQRHRRPLPSGRIVHAPGPLSKQPVPVLRSRVFDHQRSTLGGRRLPAHHQTVGGWPFSMTQDAR